MAALNVFKWAPLHDLNLHYLNGTYTCNCPEIETKELEAFLDQFDPYNKINRDPFRRAHQAIRQLLAQVSPDAGEYEFKLLFCGLPLVIHQHFPPLSFI